MILKLIRAVLRALPARLPEIVYTVLLRPKPFRAVANRFLLKLIPSHISVEGLRLYLNANDPVLSSAVAFGIYENFERKLFSEQCQPGYTVVDIGANVGLYTITAAARVGPSGRVIAIEPHIESFRHLEKTIASNNLHNVTPVNVAVGDSRRMVSLFVTDGNKADSRIYDESGKRQDIAVAMTDLDTLLAEHGIERAQVIKMDIQGAEGLALKGMKKTLANSAEVVIFAEFWPWGIVQTGVSPTSFLRELATGGFTFQSIDEDTRALIKVEDLEDFIARYDNLQYTSSDMRRSHANLICVKSASGVASRSLASHGLENSPGRL
jgi:FkbM family methyltransferase